MNYLRRRIGRSKLRTLSSVEAYTHWAQNYPPYAHNALMELEEGAVRSLLPDMHHKVVLDLACGSGRYAQIAAQAGADTIIGLDNSMAMLRVNTMPNRALSTTEALPLPDRSVDVILCGLALGHLPTLEPTMQEIARILRDGGSAIISDFHPFMFLSGGRRTFTNTNGTVFAVEHYPHLYADYHRSATANAMTIDAVLEPHLEQHAVTGPVVIVYRLCRQGASPGQQH